jgi:hypothetical protein
MSRLVDSEGRLAARINIVDALCLAFVLGLIPVAYLSWLLFRPATPRIDSIEHSRVTSAEERIAAGQPIRLKLKIRGDHLTPMLRASIGEVPAMGFTFEGPTSGDVIIGTNVRAGTHDLILYDGPLEVARARDAVVITPNAGPLIRAIGAFTLLDKRVAQSLHVGRQFHVSGHPAAEILALGDVVPDRREIKDGRGSIQAPSPDTWSRDAIVRMPCDVHPDLSRCHIGGMTVGDSTADVIIVPGSSPPLRMRVQGIVPDESPAPAVARVRLDDSPNLVKQIRVGDRDARWPPIDDRAASVQAIHRRENTHTFDVVMRLGLDRASNGWRYHSEPMLAGAPFTLLTDRYAVRGTVIEVIVDER